MIIDRPLDFLGNSKGKEVLIKLKSNENIIAKLLVFDININLVIKKNKITKFIKGDNIISVEEIDG